MSIDTPSGTINQITPIREFVELTELETTQYMLGIENMSTGNGSKITFGNIINSLISGNENNRLVKGSDDKLFVSLPIEIGDLTNLTTSNKDNLVSAINELNANMGDLSALETTATSSLVAAINSVAELTEPELLIDKVNQSKALVTGNVAGYLEELEQLKMMKRSTFDRSKFDVKGSPTITDDGIAKDFTNANYVYQHLSTKTSIDTTNAHSMDIEYEFVCTQELVDSGQVFLANYNSTAVNGNPSLQFYHKYLQATEFGTAQNVLTVGKTYKVVFNLVDSGNSYYTVYEDGVQIRHTPKSNYTAWKQNNPIFLYGHNSGSNYNALTIDLKKFNVKVDGVEVFSGNKTGIDTIKPSNLTAITSGSSSPFVNPSLPFSDDGLTISADGIVSGFSANNYLVKSVDYSGSRSWEWQIPFKTGSSVTNGERIFDNDSYSGTNYLFVVTDYGYCRVSLRVNNVQIFYYANAFSVLPNKDYIITIGYDGNQYYIKNSSISPVTSTEKFSTIQIYRFGRTYSGGTPFVFTGSINLNGVKFIKNGNLVYQPCLKIPYFESSVQYGSKIVDVQYRDRVLDAYQQGYKDYKYYTLDEENGNFTLPHGEIYGMLEQIRTENEQNNEAVRQIVDVKDNLYKILEGHQSTNKTLWDLITFTDNSEADNLLVGGDSPYASNSSSSNFHFYLLNSTTGSSYNPDDTAKANVYKLFNKSHFDSQSDPIVVQDGTIVIACANPTKLSKILLRSYDTNTALPTIITVCGANITNNMSREIVSSDFSNAKYIGGISQTKEAAYNEPTSTNWGLNRPLELTIDDKDTFNTFFINMSYWYTPSGTARRLVGIQLYGTQMTNDDSDYTVKMSGEYENCKWIASNGNIYNTDDLYQQYGHIPKEKATLARWISCFGSGIGQANATTRAAEQYYPKYISGSISSTTLTSGQPWWVLRQTNYSAENRPKTGYNTSGSGYIQKNTTLNNQTVIDYTADSYFPVGEYYWEGIFGYNDAIHNNCYLANWCQLQKVYDDDSIEIIQTFSKEGSMYESSVCYRTPRFYASRAFKKLRLIIQEENYPNNAFILSQMQLYYRDTAGTIDSSFIPSATQYDLSYNTVKHKSNIHFFITPTGVRVGSNCFVQKTDPTVRAACVGNRWINENTKKSYVCNASGVWTEEDFCEIGCMTMFGSKHVGMRLRTVANSENPMQKYIQDYEDIGGNLALNYNIVSNATTVITTSPIDPDYYFQAEAADENAGINFYMPANTVNIQAYRRALVKSKIYQSGQQFAHWSNSSRMGAVLMAYKTFDTSAAGEYIEGSEEEEQ